MDEKIKELVRTHWLILIVVVWILGVGIWYHYFHITSDNGSTAKQLRDSLDNARDQQQQTTEYLQRADDRLEDSQRTVDSLAESNNSIAGTVDTIEKRNSDSKTILDSSNEQLRRGKSIIQEIRSGTEGTSK